MPTTSDALWLCESWAAQVGPAVSAMTGLPATAHVETAQSSPQRADDLLIWRQPFDCSPGAEFWVAISGSVWAQVGALVLNSAGLEEAEASELRGTFLEVLQQSLAPLCPVLGKRLQREVRTQPGEPVDALPQLASWKSLQIEVGGRSSGTVWAAGNAALLSVLNCNTQVGLAGSGRSEPQRTSKTLDLLMEVELPVGVSFGRAQMRLKDAIKLTTGSIVELNRSISEPVEIIVNNCVIARGEVVVVEGNYGVRIRNIVSREERLRTMF